MGKWWDERVRRLLYDVKAHEAEWKIDYSEEEVRIATVHTRQDVVLVVGYLGTLNDQLGKIYRVSFLILLVLILILVSFHM